MGIKINFGGYIYIYRPRITIANVMLCFKVGDVIRINVHGQEILSVEADHQFILAI